MPPKTPDPPPAWPVRCSCGKSYTEKRWKTLKYVRRETDDDGSVLEYRVCVCSSTLAAAVPAE